MKASEERRGKPLATLYTVAPREEKRRGLAAARMQKPSHLPSLFTGTGGGDEWDHYLQRRGKEGQRQKGSEEEAIKEERRGEKSHNGSPGKWAGEEEEERGDAAKSMEMRCISFARCGGEGRGKVEMGSFFG